MIVAERATERMIRVKPHPVCPQCGVVMRYNGNPTHSPRITHYKCPLRGCGQTTKLFDAFLPLKDVCHPPGSGGS